MTDTNCAACVYTDDEQWTSYGCPPHTCRKEPRTAEGWHQWIHDTAIVSTSSITLLIIEAIRRAQKQARDEAVEECLHVIDSHWALIGSEDELIDKIRALLEKK